MTKDEMFDYAMAQLSSNAMYDNMKVYHDGGNLVITDEDGDVHIVSVEVK